MTSNFTKTHTNKAIKQRGEVFTPEALVEEVLNELPQDFFTSTDKTMLDNSCGNGNFLVKILEWRMKHGISHLDAIKTIYGVELDPANAAECRTRLSLGSTDAAVWSILHRNIVCANALDPLHSGWDAVGYMWDEKELEDRDYKLEKKRRAEAKRLMRSKKPKKVSKTPKAKKTLVNEQASQALFNHET